MANYQTTKQDGQTYRGISSVPEGTICYICDGKWSPEARRNNNRGIAHGEGEETKISHVSCHNKAMDEVAAQEKLARKAETVKKRALAAA